MEKPKFYAIGQDEYPAKILGAQGQLTKNSNEGNTRGENSTELQFVRELPERIASGNNSFIGGGQNNLVSGNNSFAAAGQDNEVAGNMSFAMGEQNSVIGNHSSALGEVNEVLGDCSHAAGSGNLISGESCFAEGDGNIVSAYAAHAEGGMNICDTDYSHAEGLAARAYNACQHAKASGGFSNPDEIGEAQYTNIIARHATEDDSPKDLLLGEEGHVILMNNKMNAFRILVAATNPDQTEGGHWELRGIIRKQDQPATVSLLGQVSKNVITKTRAGWDVNVSADTENGALKITVTGENETNIRWVAFVEMVEVAFYS